MTESVWWYVLAGFLIGFILSTLWEWLYFRRQRLRIENRRIQELEATVRSLRQSPPPVPNRAAGVAAGYQSPGVYLENEETVVETIHVVAIPEQHNQQPAAATNTTADIDSNVTANPASVPASAVAGSHRNGFAGEQQKQDDKPAAGAAAAVVPGKGEQAPQPPPAQAAPRAVASPVNNYSGGEAAANFVPGAVAVTVVAPAAQSNPPPQTQTPPQAEKQNAAPVEAPPVEAPSEDAPKLSAILPAAPKMSTANRSNGGLANSSAAPVTTAIAAAGLEPELEQLSGELNDLFKSLSGLIEETEPLLEQQQRTDTAELGTMAPQEGKKGAAGSFPATPAQPGETETTGPYSAANLSRGEYAVVRFMQSARRYAREVRSLYFHHE